MANKFQTSFNARNVAAGRKMASAYRHQFDIGMDGQPRRRGKTAYCGGEIELLPDEKTCIECEIIGKPNCPEHGGK